MIMAFTGPLEDRILIRERLDGYADCAFRGDAEAWLANWAEDCIWSGTAFELRGKEALRAQWHKLWRAMESMAFFVQVAAIEVDGERAVARSYCREIVGLKIGGHRKYVGRYDDELVRQNGQWLFARRNYTVLLDEGAAASPAHA